MVQQLYCSLLLTVLLAVTRCASGTTADHVTITLDHPSFAQVSAHLQSAYALATNSRRSQPSADQSQPVLAHNGKRVHLVSNPSVRRFADGVVVVTSTGGEPLIVRAPRRLLEGTFNRTFSSSSSAESPAKNRQQSGVFFDGGVAITALTAGTRQACATEKEVELGVTFDSVFCGKYRSFALSVDMVRATVAMASEPFVAQLCTTLTLVSVHGYCDASSDPLIGVRGDFEDILGGFMRVWPTVRPADAPPVDLQYLMSGFEDTTPPLRPGAPPPVLLGYAVVGGTCGGDGSAYGWVEKANPISLAHEIGHSLSCLHTQSGLMKASLSPDGDFYFSADSINAINIFLAGAGRCVSAKKAAPPRLPDGQTTCAAVRTFPKQFKGGRAKFDIGRPTQSFRLKLRQNVDSVRVSFKSKNSRITALAFRLSTVPDLGHFEFGQWVKFGAKGKGSVKFKIPYEDLTVPVGASSCCSQTVYLYLGVVWCDKTNISSCSRAIGSKEHTFKCKKAKK